MKKNIFTVLIFLSFITASQAQTPDFLQRFRQLQSQKNFTELQKHAARASDSLSGVSKFPEAFLAEVFHARALRKLNRLSEAAAVLQKADSLFSNSNMKHPEQGYFRSLYFLEKGTLFFFAGKNTEAARAIMKADSLLPEPREYAYADKADICNNLSAAFAALIRYKEALIYGHKALHFYKKGNAKKEKLLRVYENIGNHYISLAVFDSAHIFYSKGLKLAEHSPFLKANFLNLKGKAYASQSAHSESLYHFEQALRLIPDSVLQNDSERRIKANIFVNLGYAKQAVSGGEEAVTAFQEGKNRHEALSGAGTYYAANALNGLGGAYYYEAKYDSAKKYFKAYVKSYASALGSEHPYLAGGYSNIGLVFSALGQTDSAVFYYEKSGKILEKTYGKYHRSTLHHVMLTGDVRLTAGQYLQAAEFYAEAIRRNTFETLPTDKPEALPEGNVTRYPVIQAMLLQKKADAFFKLSQEEKSQKEQELLLRTTLAHYERFDDFFKELEKHSFNEEDFLKMGQWKVLVYPNAIETCYRLFKMTGDQEFAEKAFLLQDKPKSATLLKALRTQKALQNAPLSEEEKQELHTLKEAYNKFLTQHPEPDNAEKAKLFELRKNLKNYREGLELRHPEYYQKKFEHHDMSLGELRERLNRDEALLSYLAADTSGIVYRFLLDKKSLRFEKLEKNTLFLKTVKGLYNSILFEENKSLKRFSKSLGNYLLPELDKRIKHLVIIPDETLCRLPFEVLPVPGKGRKKDDYLIRSRSVSYHYSAKLWAQGRKRVKANSSDEHSWLAFAPVFSADGANLGESLRTRGLNMLSDSVKSDRTRGFLSSKGLISAIPATETEVRDIYELFRKKTLKAEIHTFTEASESKLKAAAPGKDFSILHMATHGFVDEENPGFSGLILSQSDSEEDNFLLASEIYGLDLQKELVVLSACETGLGRVYRGEGIMGLTRAFIFAGTQNLAVSLWKVADDRTSELMRHFYNALLSSKTKSPRDFAESLRTAKLQMIENEKSSSPYYWSGFVLIGY